MSIEGILQYEQLRDFLYSRMRGARGETEAKAAESAPEPADEALALLHEIRDALIALRATGDATAPRDGKEA